MEDPKDWGRGTVKKGSVQRSQKRKGVLKELRGDETI